jgi:hypothetical protein
MISARNVTCISGRAQTLGTDVVSVLFFFLKIDIASFGIDFLLVLHFAERRLGELDRFILAELSTGRRDGLAYGIENGSLLGLSFAPFHEGDYSRRAKPCRLTSLTIFHKNLSITLKSDVFRNALSSRSDAAI